MPEDLEPSLIEVPYGRGMETVQSTRYGWSCLDRDHAPFVILQYTLSGAGWFETGGVRAPVPAGHAFLSILPEPASYGYPPGARTPWRFCWLNFYGSAALDLWRGIRVRYGPVLSLPLESAAGRRLRRFAARVETGMPPDRFDRAVEAYALWAECLRWLAGHDEPDPLADPWRFAERNHRTAVTVKEMAAAARLSREHFSRRFRERHGCGPAGWLRRWRVSAARRLLRETDLPLSEVALRCGFGGPRQLGRALRSVARGDRGRGRDGVGSFR